jgi:hypothetical protein
MSSGELIVLSTAYKTAKQGYEEFTSAAKWLDMIAKQSGLVHPELVKIHEEGLLQRRLLTGRLHGDRRGVTLGPHFRLTLLALEICQFIDNYEEIEH